jgi:hypothetical protein
MVLKTHSHRPARSTSMHWDDYLMSDHAPDDRMGHSDLDGSSTRTVRCDSWNNGAVSER